MKLNPEAESKLRTQEYGQRSGIEGVSVIDLRRFTDDGGSMVELLRQSDGECQGLAGFRLAQVNYSCLQPGVVKAFHLHRRQTDVWFVRPEDRVLLVLFDPRQGSSTENQRMRILLGDGKAMLVRIPPGVAHGCRNLDRRPAGLVYFTDLHFSAEPDACDEGRLPWDFIGKEVWDVLWE